MNQPIEKIYSASSDYLRYGRIHSYAHQIDSVLSYSPKRVLEVGKGPGMVAASLKSLGIEVLTLDSEAVLRPDILGSVTEIPVPDEHFDVTICCQVLEHLPFDQFPLALKELRRVTRNALVLSLPDVSSYFSVRVHLFKNSSFEWSMSLQSLRPRTIPKIAFERDGHFWEIGYRGSNLGRVREEIQECGWRLQSTWRVPEKVWHRFFVLTK